MDDARSTAAIAARVGATPDVAPRPSLPLQERCYFFANTVCLKVFVAPSTFTLPRTVYLPAFSERLTLSFSVPRPLSFLSEPLAASRPFASRSWTRRFVTFCDERALTFSVRPFLALRAEPMIFENVTGGLLELCGAAAAGG